MGEVGSRGNFEKELRSVFILKKKPKGFNDGLDGMREKKEDMRGSEFGLSG